MNSLLDTVNIVFHAAALVNFEDTLTNALKINVKATLCLLELCKQMKNIQAFAYISTAYSNCNNPVIEEKLYKAKIPARDMLKMLELMDEDLLNKIQFDLIKGFPNTYTFSKHLAEDLIKSYENELPMVVFRPAIVMPTFEQPVSGWINNFYGPVGLMYGISMGALHVFQVKRDGYANLVPVGKTKKKPFKIPHY